MLKTFSLLAMCFMMTLTLQAAGFSDPQEGTLARASDMASTYLPIETQPAVKPTTSDASVPLDPLLSAVPQHNAAFTLQLSYQPTGRVRQ
jgi:hypothetical protein